MTLLPATQINRKQTIFRLRQVVVSLLEKEREILSIVEELNKMLGNNNNEKEEEI